MKSLRHWTCLLSVGLGSATLLSQETKPATPLVTDRPDATESPQALTQGYFQIETGAAYERFEQQDVHTYNTTLLRYGLLNNLELRLGWDFVETRTRIRDAAMHGVSSGFGPLLLGFKTTIVEDHAWLPTIGFLGHLSLPFTAGTDYRTETTGADFRFSFAHTLSDQTGLSYNLGAFREGDTSEIAYVYTVSLCQGITSRLSGYVEVYGDLPENNRANHYWDAGLTYLISNNLQLDATIGTGITKGQTLLLSTGISYRVPKKQRP